MVTAESINNLIAQNQFETAIEQCLLLESQAGASAALSTTIGDLCQRIGHPINASVSYIKAYQQVNDINSVQKLFLSMHHFSVEIIRQEDSIILSTVNILQHEITNRQTDAVGLLMLLVDSIGFTRGKRHR